jgi:Asp/Glu/hydantoin racemase
MGIGEDRGKVGFIHTVPSTIAMAETHMRRCLPGVGWVHMYDGTVRIANFKSPVGVTPKANLLKFATFGEQLERAGCGVIVSCCSLMPRATAFAAQAISVPFIQLDGVIIDRAVERHEKIGVITTTEHTVPYIREALEASARRRGKMIKIVYGGAPTTLALFAAGEYEKHDETVLADVRALAARGVDCILMGQIPLAMLGDRLDALNLGVPILYAGDEAFASGKEKTRIERDSPGFRRALFFREVPKRRDVVSDRQEEHSLQSRKEAD